MEFVVDSFVVKSTNIIQLDVPISTHNTSAGNGDLQEIPDEHLGVYLCCDNHGKRVERLAPHSGPKRIPRSYPSLKNTPFSLISDEKKTPLFQPKLLILRLNKTPLFKQNTIFFVIQAKVPFCDSENICNCIKLKTCFYIRRIFHYF